MRSERNFEPTRRLLPALLRSEFFPSRFIPARGMTLGLVSPEAGRAPRCTEITVHASVRAGGTSSKEGWLGNRFRIWGSRGCAMFAVEALRRAVGIRACAIGI